MAGYQFCWTRLLAWNPYSQQRAWPPGLHPRGGHQRYLLYTGSLFRTPSIYNTAMLRIHTLLVAGGWWSLGVAELAGRARDRASPVASSLSPPAPTTLLPLTRRQNTNTSDICGVADGMPSRELVVTEHRVLT